VATSADRAGIHSLTKENVIDGGTLLIA